MKFLREHFQHTGRMKFLAQAAILTFISDVINISYINLYFLPKNINTSYLLNIYSRMGVDARMLNTHYLEELKEVMINSMSMVFTAFLVYHCLVYFKLSRDKKWAKKYVFGYALTGSILTVIELPFLIQKHVGWALAMFTTTLIYIFAFQGLRFFKKKEAAKAPLRKTRAR